MNMNEFVQLIQNVGFPIIACIYMAKQNQEITKSVAKLNETLVAIDRRLEYMEKELNKHEQSK